MTAPYDGWEEANRDYLAAALALVGAAVGSAITPDANRSDAAGKREDLVRCLERARASMASPPALEGLVGRFGLSPFERDVLLLCAGAELDSSIAALCAAAAGAGRPALPTFALALEALPAAHWSALSPWGPLRRWRLIDAGSGDTLGTAPLRIEERVLHYLLGLDQLDHRLAGVIEIVAPPHDLPASLRNVAHAMTEAWSGGSGAGVVPALHLAGTDAPTRRAVAAAACAAHGLRLCALPGALLPALGEDLWGFIRLWEREAALSGCALLLECEDTEPTEAGRGHSISCFTERTTGALIVSSREPLRTLRRASIRFEVQPPTWAERRWLWHGALGPSAAQLNGEVDRLAFQFQLSAEAIAGAAAEAQRAGSVESLGDALWESCRKSTRVRLDGLARRIEPRATWDDLVLSPAQTEVLRDVARHVRHRFTVYEHWGFSQKSERGLGITALFAGPSGTGKTMAAEVLAHELQLDLYHVDLSAVVSKYIGETEKNLRRIFDTAEEGGSILLFDEADALFGKRSEVRDSHDRYSNLEVSYLLQRMEAYRGLAILTTNVKSALDSAFLRRLRFVVQFPFPDAAQRADIWRRVFPARTPVEGLDIEKLAKLNLVGGNIRNIALHAAFLAAEGATPVRMEHVLRAARAEFAKFEKTFSEAEFRGCT